MSQIKSLLKTLLPVLVVVSILAFSVAFAFYTASYPVLMSAEAENFSCTQIPHLRYRSVTGSLVGNTYYPTLGNTIAPKYIGGNFEPFAAGEVAATEIGLLNDNFVEGWSNLEGGTTTQGHRIDITGSEVEVSKQFTVPAIDLLQVSSLRCTTADYRHTYGGEWVEYPLSRNELSVSSRDGREEWSVLPVNLPVTYRFMVWMKIYYPRPDNVGRTAASAGITIDGQNYQLVTKGYYGWAPWESLEPTEVSGELSLATGIGGKTFNGVGLLERFYLSMDFYAGHPDYNQVGSSRVEFRLWQYQEGSQTITFSDSRGEIYRSEFHSADDPADTDLHISSFDLPENVWERIIGKTITVTIKGSAPQGNLRFDIWQIGLKAIGEFEWVEFDGLNLSFDWKTEGYGIQQVEFISTPVMVTGGVQHDLPVQSHTVTREQDFTTVGHEQYGYGLYSLTWDMPDGEIGENNIVLTVHLDAVVSFTDGSTETVSRYFQVKFTAFFDGESWTGWEGRPTYDSGDFDVSVRIPPLGWEISLWLFLFSPVVVAVGFVVTGGLIAYRLRGRR